MDDEHPPDAAFPDGGSAGEQPKWRRDFPVDIEADEYGARRDFTKFMVLTSLAFACGQFWIALRSLFRGGRSQRQRIAAVDDLPVGESLSFHYPTDRDSCVLIRPSPDVFLAYSSLCTHLMCPVRPQLEQNRLHCPCHEGCFDLTTGKPTAGPPRRPLPKVVLQIENGSIFVTGIEVRTT